jgi:hypothetical protein
MTNFDIVGKTNQNCSKCHQKRIEVFLCHEKVDNYDDISVRHVFKINVVSILYKICLAPVDKSHFRLPGHLLVNCVWQLYNRQIFYHDIKSPKNCEKTSLQLNGL